MFKKRTLTWLVHLFWVFAGGATLCNAAHAMPQSDPPSHQQHQQKRHAEAEQERNEPANDLQLPEGFEITELHVRLDRPDRHGMKYAGGEKYPNGVLAPILTDAPIWVEGVVSIVGRQARNASRRTVQQSEGELTLTFRSIPLIHKRKVGKALREGNTELVEVKEDAANGTARMIWHVDPLPPKQIPKDGEKEANNEERTKWRTRESDQEYHLKIPLVVPSKP